MSSSFANCCICATASDSDVLGGRPAETVTWRCRFRRLIDDGATPSLILITRSKSTVPPLDEPTVKYLKLLRSRRYCSSARTTTSYCCEPSLYAETIWPADRIFNACATSPARTPRSAALVRSIVTRTSGLPISIEVSGSRYNGTSFIFATIALAYSVSFSMSGPAMYIPTEEPPRPKPILPAMDEDAETVTCQSFDEYFLTSCRV